ncbi:MAG: YdgA family protein, partial [Alphaproteobacteria bacterium]|nr:YdgA family protein [Alphaproteobacteria bacterium]
MSRQRPGVAAGDLVSLTRKFPMKKHICGFAALVALVFTFTGSAYAEGIIGAQYGRSYVELTPGQDTKGHGSRAGKFQSGAFAQYR